MVSTALEHLGCPTRRPDKARGEARRRRPGLVACAGSVRAGSSTEFSTAHSGRRSRLHPRLPCFGVRTQCVDCEAHRDERKADRILPPPSCLPAEESWVSAHGTPSPACWYRPCRRNHLLAT
jgi:hypothetical protein